MPPSIAELAKRQCGMLSHVQLRQAGLSAGYAVAQRDAARWTRRTDTVLSTTTGPLSHDQRLWLAVLHAGGDSLLGGLTAAARHGLARWDRESITVLVDNPSSFEPVDGVTFFRTRRPLASLRCPESTLPVARLEPAILLFAAHEPHPRTALGAVSACVQQGLTTPNALRPWIRTLRPLRRAEPLRTLLDEIDGGSQSLTEIDVVRACRAMGLVAPRRQVQRRGRDGRKRFTDCEWDLPDGRVLVLEIDGAFHTDVVEYTADIQRARSLTTAQRIVIRCSAHEIRHEPWVLIADLRSLGVPAA